MPSDATTPATEHGGGKPPPVPAGARVKAARNFLPAVAPPDAVEPTAEQDRTPDAPPAPGTRRVRVSARHGDQRMRAGVFVPAGKSVDADVTPEQLAELEADAVLMVLYDGKPDAGPNWTDEPELLATHSREIAAVRETAARDVERLRSMLAMREAEHVEALERLRKEHREELAVAVENARTEERARAARG